MALTSHGHHIPGTSRSDFKPKDVTLCGGPEECPRCKSEVESSVAFITRKTNVLPVLD